MSKRIIALVSVTAIVLLCSFGVYADTTYYGPTYTFAQGWNIISQTGYNPIQAYLNLTSFPSSNDAFENVGAAVSVQTFKVLGEFIIFNRNNEDIIFTGSMPHLAQCYIVPINSYESQYNIKYNLTDVQYIGGTLNISSVTTNSIFIFENTIIDQDGKPNPIIIPKQSSVCCYFELTYECVHNYNIQFPAPQFNSTSTHLTSQVHTGTFGEYHENYISYIPDIYDQLVSIYASNQNQLSVLQQILASYNSNVPIAEDATSDSQSSQTTSEQQHQVELSQFNNTNTALSNSGISNYSFNQEQIGGIGGVSNDFTYVFNALGSWNQVYIFALTLSLALAIIRHVRPKRSTND